MLQIDKIRINLSEEVQTVEKPPVLSLVCRSTGKGERIAKYAVRVTYERKVFEWTALPSEQDPAYVRFPDEFALAPHTRYLAQARVWDQTGTVSAWSPGTVFKTAFLSAKEWKGRYISAAGFPDEEKESPCFLFMREFDCPQDLEDAQLHITAKGVYAASLNGRRVSRDVLTPGYMSYNKHLAYQSYDVSDLLRPGRNLLEVLVGDGWYKGFLTSSWHRNYYGGKRELLCELRMQDIRGVENTVCSDQSFSWRPTSILRSEIYCGELCDRSEQDIPDRRPVEVGRHPWDEALHPSLAQPMRYGSPLAPERMLITPKGEYVLDFGRVLSGTIEMEVSGPKGSRVVLRCGDTLDAEGNFYNDNVELFSMKGQERHTVQRLEYRLAGHGREVYRPSFTYQCFRYVHIAEFPGEPRTENFHAIPITSFTAQTGFFRCGHQGVNRLFENIIQTEKATFQDIPVAGPQRAERLGWTGDNQLITPSCCRTMFETRRFFGKWLADAALDQGTDGQLGTMAPYVSFSAEEEPSEDAPSASAAWGDAAVIVPWELYAFYGDKTLLEKYLPLARGYVEYMRRSGTDEVLFTEGFSFGDWFALDDGEDAYPGKTDKTLVACFYFYRSVTLLARMLRAAGQLEEAEQYSVLADRIRAKLASLYFDQDGRLLDPTQTGAAMALEFGIAPKPAKAAEQLAELIRNASGHLLTGFLGTSVVMQALCRNGYAGLAYDALLCEEYPSWLYAVGRGATTVWEHWNGVKPDGSLWDPNMNSFCHLTFGSVAEWLFGFVLGIRQEPEQAGYEAFLMQPYIDRRLGFAEGSFETVRGTIRAGWKFQGPELRVFLEVPTGASARVELPLVKDADQLIRELACGGFTDGVIRRGSHAVAVHCEAGNHVFRYTADAR